MSEELKLYEKNFGGGRPPEYLYGPSWKAMELMMEGGFKTPEEAKAAWERESRGCESDPPVDFGPTRFEQDDSGRLCCSECSGSVEPTHKFCPHCGRRRVYG